jgi:hypothetical protein
MPTHPSTEILLINAKAPCPRLGSAEAEFNGRLALNDVNEYASVQTHLARKCGANVRDVYTRAMLLRQKRLRHSGFSYALFGVMPGSHSSKKPAE